MCAPPGRALAQEEPVAQEEFAAQEELANFRYAVSFSGLENKELEALLRSVSASVAKADKPVEDMFLLQGAPPQHAKPGITLRLCTQGSLAARHVARRDAAAYKQARKLDWGDLWAPATEEDAP